MRGGRWRFFWQGGDQKNNADDRPAVGLLLLSKGGGGDLVGGCQEGRATTLQNAAMVLCFGKEVSMEVFLFSIRSQLRGVSLVGRTQGLLQRLIKLLS